MSFSFSAGVRDSLSNLAASLGTGRDKASHDAFTVFDLGRAQIEAMYRGDWLARKVVDIVPYDSVRAWRAWSGPLADVARFEAAERRLGLRKTVQRAMTLGRLYGGGAILIGDGETDEARLARPLDPRLPRDGLLYLHALSRWQVGVTETELNPLSPWMGEPKMYTLSSPGQPVLELHPSRVVRFLGNPLPDPSVVGAFWSDSILQALYDAVHAAALSLAGATSLLHEAKVDVVTVPNLSEHLSSAETTEQLSARFAYAAAMKSMNNLLLLGDGESWSRQTVDFAGLPEMARTFLQVAAGAADIPVTRLLGQSPAGLSSTGESDVRNYYDMIAARQELDLRPQLERLDRLICWSEDIDEEALSFAFRPLWQLDEPARAALALTRAQATQVYAGLKLWPDAVVARLAEAQLVADGTYPNAAAVFAESKTAGAGDAAVADAPWAGGGSLNYLHEKRNRIGEWTEGDDDPADADPDGGDDTGNDLLNFVNWREKKKRRLKAKRHRERARKREREERRRQRHAEQHGRSEETEAPDTEREEKSSAPPAGESGKPPSSVLTPHSSLPDSERDATELPPGVTPQEAKEIHLNSSPVGISFPIKGDDTTTYGGSYSDSVNAYIGAEKPEKDFKKGGLNPDGAMIIRSESEKIVVEAKYVGTWSKSVYNPDRTFPFEHAAVSDIMDQSKKYSNGYDRVDWYTNSLEFARAYAKKFKEAGIENFTFTIIPTRRVKS